MGEMQCARCLGTGEHPVPDSACRSCDGAGRVALCNRCSAILEPRAVFCECGASPVPIRPVLKVDDRVRIVGARWVRANLAPFVGQTCLVWSLPAAGASLHDISVLNGSSTGRILVAHRRELELLFHENVARGAPPVRPPAKTAWQHLMEDT